MAAAAAPYGLIPVSKQGGRYNEGGSAREIQMTTNVALAFYVGQVVVLGTNGQVTPPATSPYASDTVPVLGVVTGIRFVDPVLKYSVQDSYLPSGAVNSGYTDIWITVNDDPDQLYQVQANGTVAASSRGLNFQLTGTQSGSATTKRSSIAVVFGSGAAAVTTSTVRLVDFVRSVASQPGDAYTDLIVRFSPGVHAYEKTTGPS